MKELKVLETEPVGLAGQIKEKATEKIGRMLENVKFSFKHSLLKAGKSMALFSDPAIALAVVKKDGLALEYMKKTRITYYDMGDVSDAWAYYDVDEIFSFQDDREIVLAAVRNNGLALMYASKDLQGDREVVLAAMRQNPEALKYASRELQNDEEMKQAKERIAKIKRLQKIFDVESIDRETKNSTKSKRR